MAKDGVKNFLRKAKKADLDGRFKFKDFIGKGDDDDIFKFKLGAKSSFNLKLRGLKDNADVELYTFDGSRSAALKKIGKTPFSDISKKQVRQYLERVERSRNSGKSAEKIKTELEAGEYYLRIMPRRASKNSTKYKLIMTAKELPDAGSGTGTGGTETGGTGTGGTGTGGTGTGGTGTGGTGTGGTGTGPTAPPADGNNTIATAKALTVDFRSRTYNNNSLPAGFTNRTFYLGASDTEDWFKFQLQTESVFNLNLNGLSTDALSADLDVELRDQYGAVLSPPAESIRSGTSPEAIVNRTLSAGSYLIRVNRPQSGESDYSLKLSALPANTDPNLAGETIATARTLTLDGDLAGSSYTNKIAFNDFVGGADSNDYFKVVLPTGGGSIRVDVDEIEDDDIDGRTSNLNLQIIPATALNASGVVVRPEQVISSSRPGENREELAGAFEAGTYYIRIYPATEADGAFYRMNLAAFSTLDQPSLTRDINLGSPSSLTGTNLVGDGDTGTGVVYFAANDGTGLALWQSEGTYASTQKIGAPTGSTTISNLINVNGTVYFMSNGNGLGTELWKYDGSQISLVKDIAPGVNSGLGGDPEFTVVNGKLYFVADNGPLGRELWVTDGTANGTTNVANIAIENNATARNADPTQLTAVGNILYFAAQNAAGEEDLYRYDTSTGATPVKVAGLDTDAAPANLTVANGKLYFNAFGTNGDGLWVINNPTTSATVTELADPTDFGSSSPEYGEFVAFNNTLYFVARDDQSTRDIWRVNTAGTGVERVAGLSGTANLNPQQLTVVNNTLYFVGATSDNSRHLWISDGNIDINLNDSTGTRQLTTGLTNLGNLTVIGSTPGSQKFYFTADDGINGNELWTSNGTTGGTVMVGDIRIGSGSSGPSNLVEVGDRLFFKANNGEEAEGGSGIELWSLGIEA